MAKKTRKRKHQHSTGAHPAYSDAANFSVPSPPPLPSLCVPSFALSAENLVMRDDDGCDAARGNPAKKHKKEKHHSPVVPSFNVSPQRMKRMLRVADLQELVLWLLADGCASQWLLVKQKNDIKKVVVVMVPGLDMEILNAPPEEEEQEQEQEDEDMGEVLDRSNVSATPAQSSVGAVVGIAAAEEKKKEVTVERWPPGKQQSNDDAQWTVVGSKNSPTGGSAFSFYPSLLSGRPLRPCLEPLRDMFTHVWPTKADGDDKSNKILSPITNFLNSPIDKRNMPNVPKQSRRIGVTELLVKQEDLRSDGYPMHSMYMRKAGEENDDDEIAELNRLKAEGWVETEVTGTEVDTHNEARSISEGRIIYSVDCEMCITEAGSELTRISVIGWDGKVVYDTLVKPSHQISDYLTQFSGITEERLRDVKTTLADVQSQLLKLFQPAHKVILIGQSLQFDLKALKFIHPYIVDTALIYEHPKGAQFKVSLKYLAKKYLSREIQTGKHRDPQTNKMEKGHDSIEDALACLDLVKLKCEKGHDFGTKSERTESLFTRIERGNAAVHGTSSGHRRCWGAAVDYGNPAGLYGRFAKRTIACQSDDEVVAGVTKALDWQPTPSADGAEQRGDKTGTDEEQGDIAFVWARFKELERLRGWDNSVRQTELTAVPTVPQDPPKRELEKKMREMVERLKKIYDGLKPGTAFIVYSGTGDPREMSVLNAMQRRFREEFKVKKWDELEIKWTDDENQRLNRAIKRAKEGGLSFLTVKN